MIFVRILSIKVLSASADFGFVVSWVRYLDSHFTNSEAAAATAAQRAAFAIPCMVFLTSFFGLE